MKYIYSILVIVMSTAITNYVDKNEKANKCQTPDLSFEKRIILIHKKVTDLTDIFVLHTVVEFNEIYLNPERFKDSAIVFLGKQEKFENKVIAICSMTKLPFNKYIDMLNSCYVLYNHKKISEDLLSRFTFNEFDIKNTLIKNYKDPQVRRSLKRILQSKSLSQQFKVNIIEALNGKTYHDLKQTGHL